MGRFPSGQRGQTVNLLAPPSKVRILLSPKRYLVKLIPLFFYRLAVSSNFFDQGLNFSCKQCSCCCRHEPGYVYLSQVDLSTLAKAFNVTESDFIKSYCRIVPYHDGTDVLCLQEKTNFDCIFWNEGCIAYSARPIQCSTYPFWTFLLESKDRWNNESGSCPGINFGPLLKKDEIYDRMCSYRDNNPLRVTGNMGEDSE